MATPAAVAAPIPTRETLIERARALIPALKARSEAAVAARCVPAETIREMAEAGFLPRAAAKALRRITSWTRRSFSRSK